MQIQQVLDHLRKILDGIDPTSGSPISEHDLLMRESIRDLILAVLEYLDQVRVNGGTHWLPEDYAMLTDACRRGDTLGQIAELLGREPGAVRKKMRQENLVIATT